MLAKDHANPAPGPYKQHSPPVHKTQPPIWLCGLRETMNAFPSPQRNKTRGIRKEIPAHLVDSSPPREL